MANLFKQFVQRTPFYYPWHNWKSQRRQIRDLARWEQAGRPMPPPHLIKQQTLRDHARRYQLRILVETGTFRGEMVEAMRRHFDRVYSIELGEALYHEACRRFRGDSKVHLILGDSGVQLGRLIPQLDHGALFWLDGHYSAGITARGPKDTPIFEELEHLFAGPDLGHVAIVDDARCFGVEPGYPSLADLKSFVASRRKGCEFQVENDSLRIITPAAIIRRAGHAARRAA